KVKKALNDSGIPAMIYYPKPMHAQEAFAGTWSAVADNPVTEKLCKTVLALPMHPYLTEAEVQQIAETVAAAVI
ncbi:MAG: DegT/DnrJ/EryC1/StrS family aminotransferase, partial [Lachnospiraceae bacterium]|nr:DegT/DnrJ/EryC1/StrS family aminotransferase [Lachnospiraceae bacterium]